MARDPSARPLWVEEKPQHHIILMRCISLNTGKREAERFPKSRTKASGAEKLQFVINHLFSRGIITIAYNDNNGLRSISRINEFKITTRLKNNKRGAHIYTRK